MDTWIGVIENRIDPLKTLRVQVRIVGLHTNSKEVLPTASLPWAMILETGIQYLEGDYVFGMFLDSESQFPVVLGRLPGIPDQLLETKEGFCDPRGAGELRNAPRVPKNIVVSAESPVVITEQDTAQRYPNRLNEPTVSRLARGEGETILTGKKDTLMKSIPIPLMKSWDEPESPSATVYPYNRVLETESGHIVEVDDTPGAERIHIYHRSGTFTELHPNGTRVDKTHADSFEIVLGEKNIYLNGDWSLTTKKNLNLKAGGDLNIEAGGAVNIKATQAIKIQGQSIIGFAQGPMLLTGLPLSLNPPAPIPPLGPPTGPIVLGSTGGTVTPPIQPVPTDPGNIALVERPGANVGEKKPSVLAEPSASPSGIPTPTENVAPVSVMTNNEGADVMIRALNRNNISDPIQRAQIYAQAAHESANFTRLIESFKYTDKGLIATWPSRFTSENVKAYSRNPEKIANFVYANRMGNGNEATGDGWKYRGRGFIQLTGKENYVQASLALQQDFINSPDAACAPDTAADIAIWYFKAGKKTGYRGSYADILAATKFVNGGTNGLEDRTKKFEVAKATPLVTILNTGLV